jgi:hypothetical protein
MNVAKAAVAEGKTFLGIELGSTRIKAVLIFWRIRSLPAPSARRRNRIKKTGRALRIL